MSKLVYPTLDLFLYHLREGLGVNEDKIRANYQDFLTKLPHNLPASLTQKAVTEDTEYIEFLDIKNSQKGCFKFTGCLHEYELDGYYSRFCQDDTYGVLYNISFQGKFTPQQLANGIEEIKYLAPEHLLHSGKLGQTWMISAWLDDGSDAELETLATDVYKSLIFQEWQYQERGEFLGGTVFEFWRSSPERWENIETESHVVMFLYPNEQAMMGATGFYEYWKALFCYRNKILWAYGESRELKQLLLHEFNLITRSIQNISQLDLKQLKYALQTNLETIAKFVNKLNDLEVQRRTIEVNLHKYEKYLEMIESKAGEAKAKTYAFGSDGKNLKFLQEFSNNVRVKYEKQIEQDYASIRPCLDVMENLTATIRGMVEISQAESDRVFQTRVQVAGAGLGTSAVVATATSPVAKDIAESTIGAIAPKWSKDWGVQLGTTLSLSIIAGLLASLAVMGFLGLLPPAQHKQKRDR